MRVRFQGSPSGYAHPVLLQTFWRPGTAGGSTADATDALTRVRAMLLAAVGAFSSGLGYTGQAEVDVLEDTTGAITGTFTGVPGAQVQGTVSGDMLPAQISYVVRANTSLIVGRRFLKGRTFFAGAAENNSGGLGTPVGSTVTALNSAFNGMLTGGGTASFPVIWHRPTKALPSSGTSGPVVNYSTDPARFGDQRRRRA